MDFFISSSPASDFSFADFDNAFGDLPNPPHPSTSSSSSLARSTSVDDWGSFQGVEGGAGKTKGLAVSAETLAVAAATGLSLPQPPPSSSSSPSPSSSSPPSSSSLSPTHPNTAHHLKTPAKQMRQRGWGITGRNLVLKSVWLTLTPAALLLHKSALDSSKTHFSLPLARARLLEASPARRSSAAGSAAGSAALTVTYTSEEEPAGRGRVELIAASEEEARRWAEAIECNWLLAQRSG